MSKLKNLVLFTWTVQKVTYSCQGGTNGWPMKKKSYEGLAMMIKEFRDMVYL
jgi:hypothetical protein